MIDKIKKAAHYVWHTKLGKLMASGVLSLIFGILLNFESCEDWAYIGLLISWIYPAGLLAVMMVYAWIINPIRSIRKK